MHSYVAAGRFAFGLVRLGAVAPAFLLRLLGVLLFLLGQFALAFFKGIVWFCQVSGLAYSMPGMRCVPRSGHAYFLSEDGLGAAAAPFAGASLGL
jgi:hypothetical protein